MRTITTKMQSNLSNIFMRKSGVKIRYLYLYNSRLCRTGNDSLQRENAEAYLGELMAESSVICLID